MNNTSNIQSYLAQIENRAGSGDPALGARQTFQLLASKGNPDLKSVFNGLADGYAERDELVRKTLCSLMGTLCSYLSEIGALIIITLGIFQGLQTLRSVGSALFSTITSLVDLFVHPLDSLSSVAKKLFGGTKSDAQTDAAISFVEGAVLAVLPAPFAALRTLTGRTSVASSPGVTLPSGVVPSAPTVPIVNTPSVPAASGGSTTTQTLAQAIAAGVLSAIGGTADRQSVLRDAYKAVRKGGSPEQIHAQLVARYSN